MKPTGKIASYLVPRRRRLACGLVLGRRVHEKYVESMAVVAIVFMLMASAAEAYRYAIGKAAMVEAANLMTGLRTSLAEYFAVTGRLPATTWVTDSDGGRFFRSMEWHDDEIVLEVSAGLAERIALRPQAGGDTPAALSFRVARTADGEREIFLCGFSDPPAGFSVGQSRHTTVSEAFLPFFCRS